MQRKDPGFTVRASAGELAAITVLLLLGLAIYVVQIVRMGCWGQPGCSAASSWVVQARGINLPQQLDKKYQDRIDSLAKKTGVDFDKSYMDEVIDSHEEDIDNFEKAAKDAKDASVKEFASTSLTSLREHLQAAQALEVKVKG